MRIFITWSGSRSKKVADYLNDWLRKLPLQIEPWVSKTGIDPGTRWEKGLSGALEGSDFGVLCLIKENQAEAWVCFEAGALSKITEKAYVVPYLIGMKPSELEYPLKQFQAVEADKDGTWDLIKLIHKATRDQTRTEKDILEAFDIWWLKLEQVIIEAQNEVQTLEPKKVDLEQIQASIERIGAVVESLSSRFTQFVQCSTPGPRGYGQAGAGYGLPAVPIPSTPTGYIIGEIPGSAPFDFKLELEGGFSQFKDYVDRVLKDINIEVHHTTIRTLIHDENRFTLEFNYSQPPPNFTELLRNWAQESGVQVKTILRKA